ncbi:hypothetical protein [Cochleicola gelatinilyticus]|uniref:Uncharacterized protein n=1 Tax=Cochleicola gelatinilyticus TaxID=1763537 RepID=A0A167IPF3_9FLAO|nr:hypothetical protein [Cochleicola gelatinilyticus]OAB79878.1 hypothetical protein ULVI_03825 [Cochleicola gelatinilyticus]
MRYTATVHRLIPKTTALWAFSESGLGGIMHAIRIPFSGIFLGSISVILITFLAFHSKNRWKTIIQALLLVLMLKAMISPHSPVMAYVAVAFQGVLGATLYSIFGVNRWSAISFGCIALLESAFQKILTLTLIFGVELWEALDTFFQELTQKLQLDGFDNIPIMLITAYGILYGIVGILAGNFAFLLPKRIEETAAELATSTWTKTAVDPLQRKKSKRFKRLFFFVSILLFILTLFLFTGKEEKIGYVVLRSLLIIALFLWVITPLVRYLLRRWVENRNQHQKKLLDEVLVELPLIRENTSLANQLTGTIKNPLRRAKRFLLVWFSLSLYFEKE